MKAFGRITIYSILIFSLLFVVSCGKGGSGDGNDGGDGNGGDCSFDSLNGNWNCSNEATGGCRAGNFTATITTNTTSITFEGGGVTRTVPLNGNTFVLDASDPGQDTESLTCTIISYCDISCRDQGQNINSGDTWDCQGKCTR
jgi:hypothetical protein